MTKAAPYDVVVLGGGITGVGIARDAALRGMTVALFEKRDVAAGTSSKSSKLIHGGLRYLEHGEFGLVFESVSERAVQRQVAPHLVRPLPFLVPVYKDAKPGLEILNIGLWIYDTMALFRAPKLHRTFRGDRAAELEPALRKDGLRGAIEYYDCVTDDARLVVENAIDAEAAGADIHTYTEVVKILRTGGQVSGVRVRDVFTGAEREVAAKCVIVAAGPWTDALERKLGLGFGRRILRPTKGVHIVFPRDKLPLRRAITLISQTDGRVMFAIPWKGRTVLGTTDTDFDGDPDDVHADAADVRYLCDGANAYFPDAHFRPDEVIATWAGLRPLIDDRHASTGEVSREHEIYVHDDGVIVIAGGKLTTYRRMAKECVKKAIKWLDANRRADFDAERLRRPRTKTRPLPGAAGLPRRSMTGVREFAHRLADEFGIAADTATHLANTYGTRAKKLARAIHDNPSLGERINDDLPYVWAEIDFAVQDDMARTVDDILARRVPLLLVGRDQGLDVVDRVADRAATLLGWPADVRARHVDAYRAEVAASRRFRGG
ncbi:MAG: glycerol-3-phosphate dehydrogenase [Deltaproteobacteria bacterium]|nr:MAG: glycerol-3-phosphate dehydrogenase [Deltaproteobacteria bacterium]